MVVQQAAQPHSGQATRSKVVIYDPISWELPEWSYEPERSILEPRGVELVVPSDPAEAERAIVDADVVIVVGHQGPDGRRRDLDAEELRRARSATASA